MPTTFDERQAAHRSVERRAGLMEDAAFLLILFSAAMFIATVIVVTAVL